MFQVSVLFNVVDDWYYENKKYIEKLDVALVLRSEGSTTQFVIWPHPKKILKLVSTWQLKIQKYKM